MKKTYIIIAMQILLIISVIIIFKQNKDEKIIEQINNNLNIEIKEEIKEETKKIEEECKIINTPLMSKYEENEYPVINSNGPITEDKLKTIIDNQLPFLIYKNNYQEITNEDLFYEALTEKSISEKETFTKEEINNILEKTVLSNLKLKHESHYSKTNYNYIYENEIYTIDNSNYKNTNEHDEQPLYGEVQSFEEKNGIYKINIKYLWTTKNNETSTIIYKNRYDAKKKINKIQKPNNTKCETTWIKETLNKYSKELPTYVYSFKEINNHIYLVDYYIKDNN